MKREHEWRFKRLDDPAQKADAVGSIDNQVVVGERQRQHEERRKLAALLRVVGSCCYSRAAPIRRFPPTPGTFVVLPVTLKRGHHVAARRAREAMEKAQSADASESGYNLWLE